jgi:chitodextrinase
MAIGQLQSAGVASESGCKVGANSTTVCANKISFTVTDVVELSGL